MVKYILIVALGAICYGTLSSIAKIAYGDGYNAGEITFAQAFLGALMLWLMAFIKNTSQGKFKVAFNWKPLLAGTSMGCSAYCFYLSVKYIPVSLSIVLLMQVSWMSRLAEWLLFGKKPRNAEWVSTAFIITGTVLAGNLFNTSYQFFSTTGIILAIAAACFYTVYVLFTSKLANNIPKLEKSALMTTGSAIMILLINLPSMVHSSHLDTGLLKWGTFLAVFGTVIPPICFTVGMPKIGPGLSAILLTLELPAVVLCAHLILKEPVTSLQITGILMMIGAIIYLNLSKNNNQQQSLQYKVPNEFV